MKNTIKYAVITILTVFFAHAWAMETKPLIIKPFSTRNIGKEITALTFDAQGKNLIVGLRDKTVRVINLKGKELKKFEGNYEIVELYWSPFKEIVGVSRDGYQIIWNWDGKIIGKHGYEHPERQSNLFVFMGDPETSPFLIVGKDSRLTSGDRMTLIAFNNKTNIYDQQNSIIAIFEGSGDAISAVAASRDGRLIAGGTKDGKIIFYKMPPDIAHKIALAYAQTKSTIEREELLQPKFTPQWKEVEFQFEQ